MIERYHTTKLALAQQVLTSDSANEAGLVLLVTLLAWYVITVIANLSWGYALLAFYSLRQKLISFPAGAKLVLGGYLLINLAITLGFLFERLFLSKRYLIALSLIFLLCVPFALEALWQNRAVLRQRMLLGGSAFLIGFAALGGIFDFGYSKSYIHAAGDWLAAHVRPADALYVNDYQLMYYSQHFGIKIFQNLHDHLRLRTIAEGRWKQYDYIALRLDKKDQAEAVPLLHEMQRLPEQVFSNKRGDRVAIYKVRRD